MKGPRDRGKRIRLTRSSLIQKLPDWGDGHSWQQFYDTYWRLILNTALQAGLTHTEAEEVVQTTLIHVSKNVGGFKCGKEHGSFTGWLLKTISWKVADQFRKRRPEQNGADNPSRHETRTDPIDQLPDPCMSEEKWKEEYEKNLLHVALERAKHRVDLSLFQWFDLHVLQGIPAPKVAEMLGLKLSQVYSAKYKITEILESEVNRLRREQF